MVTATQAQDVSKFLARSLKEKGVKQSEILELLSHFEGYKDWNTFKAVDEGTASYKENKNEWTSSQYVHVDNGGYFFSYHKKKKMLKVENSFFGYTNNIIKIKMTKKELQKVIFTLEVYKENCDSYIDYDGNNSFLQEGKNWSIEGYNLIFFRDGAVMELILYNIQEMISSLRIVAESIKDNE